MDVIPVPRPSKNAMNPDRPANALLLSQVEHFRKAERDLPLRYRSDIYVKAIKTEREASRYIREVTEAIHQAHEDAAAERAKIASRRPQRGITLAASAAKSSRKKTASKGKGKNSTKHKRK
jgi:hypothetical protein